MAAWIFQGLEPLCHVHHTSTQGLLEHLFFLNLQGLELEQMRIFSKEELIWTTLSPCYPGCFLLPKCSLALSGCFFFPGYLSCKPLWLCRSWCCSKVTGKQRDSGTVGLLPAFGTLFPPRLGEQLFVHPLWRCFLLLVWGYLSAPT